MAESTVRDAGVDEVPIQVALATDDDDLRDRINEVLERNSYEPILARTGDDLLTHAIDHRPDILFIDETLPGVDAREVCRRLRITESGAHAHIAVVTGNARGAQAAINAGADDVLERPVEPHLVAAQLRCGERVARLHNEIDEGRARERRLSSRVGELHRAVYEARANDSLTQVRSQRFAIEKLHKVWPQPASTELTLVMFRVDGIGDVNVHHGRLAGDALLVDIAAVMLSQKRAADLLCRLGGAVFGILCRTDPEGARTMAERFRSTIERHRFRCVPDVHHFTVSIGVATRADWMKEPSDLIRGAELALRDALAAGGNTAVAASAVAPVGAGHPDHST